MDTASQPQSTTLTRVPHDKFVALLGHDHVRPASPADPISGIQPQLALEPANEHQLADALRFANIAGLSAIPRGGGTKLGWGNPPSRADVVISTTRLNRVLEHAWADLTVT